MPFDGFNREFGNWNLEVEIMTPAKKKNFESWLNVAMIAAEAAPFAKGGGLGDVVGALPKALEKPGRTPLLLSRPIA